MSGRNIKLVARYLRAVNKNKNDGYQVRYFSFFAHTTHSFAAFVVHAYICMCEKDLFKV